jgi:hypothetical protein
MNMGSIALLLLKFIVASKLLSEVLPILSELGFMLLPVS